MKNRCGLYIVGEREFVDQLGMAEDQSQIECDSLSPSELQRNTKYLRTGFDKPFDTVRVAVADPPWWPRS
jgi:hypothetical protein